MSEEDEEILELIASLESFLLIRRVSRAEDIWKVFDYTIKLIEEKEQRDDQD